MRILIASDGSASSEPIIVEAAKRPWPPGSEFTVVTAVALILGSVSETVALCATRSVEVVRRAQAVDWTS